MNHCPHNPEHECFTCADNRHRNAHPTPVDGCDECKYASIQLTPSLTHPGRISAPPAGNKNSWENGRVTDTRGVPYLVGNDHHELGVKELADHRGKYEGQIRDRFGKVSHGV